MTQKRLDAFTVAYIECALWTSRTDDGEPMDREFSTDDLASETVDAIAEDCARFQDQNRELYENEPDRQCSDGRHSAAAQAGHDFWLTRNGHGTGFWEPGRWPEGIGRRLTDSAKRFGECDLYVGDDGKLYGA